MSRLRATHTPVLLTGEGRQEWYTLDTIGTRELLEFLRTRDTRRIMGRMVAKRTLAVSVKMSPEDAALLKKAAAHLWPGAPVTRSSYVLALAKMGAEAALARPGREKK